MTAKIGNIKILLKRGRKPTMRHGHFLVEKIYVVVYQDSLGVLEYARAKLSEAIEDFQDLKGFAACDFRLF